MLARSILCASSIASAGVIVGADATGFETRHPYFHYAFVCNLRRTFTKMSAIYNTATHLVGAIVIEHHSVRYNIKYFPELFKKMSELTDIKIIVLDKGYDTEYVHKLILSAGAISVIPTRGDDVSI